LAQADPKWIIGGASLTFLLIVLLALRWQIFLKKQRVSLPLTTLVPLTWSGQFFNSILPGSTGGDFIKIYQLCRFFPERKADTAITVVMDRLSALVALVVLAAADFAVNPISWSDIAGGTPFGNSRVLAMLLGAGVFGGVATLIIILKSPKIRAHAAKVLQAIKRALSPDRYLAAGIVLSFVLHLLNFLIIFCFGQAIGLTMSYFKALQFLPVLLLLVMMPVTVNGHGLREVLLIFYFKKLGIISTSYGSVTVEASAIALSALMVMNDLLWSLPGGLWYVLRFKKRPDINSEQIPELHHYPTNATDTV
jgi:uncharacterized membrane protein YbhN (UPF0104 family)